MVDFGEQLIAYLCWITEKYYRLQFKQVSYMFMTGVMSGLWWCHVLHPWPFQIKSYWMSHFCHMLPIDHPKSYTLDLLFISLLENKQAVDNSYLLKKKTTHTHTHWAQVQDTVTSVFACVSSVDVSFSVFVCICSRARDWWDMNVSYPPPWLSWG